MVTEKLDLCRNANEIFHVVSLKYQKHPHILMTSCYGMYNISMFINLLGKRPDLRIKNAAV